MTLTSLHVRACPKCPTIVMHSDGGGNTHTHAQELNMSDSNAMHFIFLAGVNSNIQRRKVTRRWEGS